MIDKTNIKGIDNNTKPRMLQLECRDTVRLPSLLILISSRFFLEAYMTNLNLFMFSRDRVFPNKNKVNFFNDLQRAVERRAQALDSPLQNRWLTWCKAVFISRAIQP